MNQITPNQINSSSSNCIENVFHSILATIDLYDNTNISNDVRVTIMDKCIEICKKMKFSPSDLTK